MFLYIHSNNTKLFSTEGVNEIHRIGRVCIFFFLSNFLQKKVKLSENLEKQFQKISWIQPNVFEIFYCGFFFQQYSTHLEHTRK
jgi:hypothetical protein